MKEKEMQEKRLSRKELIAAAGISGAAFGKMKLDGTLEPYHDESGDYYTEAQVEIAKRHAPEIEAEIESNREIIASLSHPDTKAQQAVHDARKQGKSYDAAIAQANGLTREAHRAEESLSDGELKRLAENDFGNGDERKNKFTPPKSERKKSNATREKKTKSATKNQASKSGNADTLKLTAEQKEFLYSGDTSDLDFARRIEFMYGDIIRYLQDTNCWLILDKNEQGGGIWKNRGEKKAVLERYTVELADALIANAANAEQAKLGKHLKKQRNRTQALETTKGLAALIIHPEDLNKPKHLINVLNGVVDLKTGELLPLDPDYLILNQAGAAYAPDADTSFVEKFLAEILPDEETRRAVLRYLGYCLTGMKNYHVSEFWRGQTGANGKSTLIDFVTKVFGSYAKKMPSAGLLESRRPVDGNSATPAIAQLDGDIRLAIIDELPRNVRLDAALFKTLTGDEFAYARPLYCNPRMIELRAKFIINGNHLPNFDVDDGGLERRITTIPFNQKFTGTRVDSRLSEKLSTPENLSALLKILVGEAKAYYADGLLESEEMKAAKEEYYAENDFVGTFLIENCITEHGGYITRRELEEKLIAAYPKECARLKKKELLNQLIAKLEPHGVVYTKRHANRLIFKNIRWLEEYND